MEEYRIVSVPGLILVRVIQITIETLADAVELLQELGYKIIRRKDTLGAFLVEVEKHELVTHCIEELNATGMFIARLPVSEKDLLRTPA